MLTSRAWWLLLGCCVLLLLGLFGRFTPVTVLALGLLLWMAWEAVRFSFQVRWVVRNLKLKRQIYDDRGPVSTLWAGRHFEVRTTLSIEGLFSLPYVAIEDQNPFGSALISGSPREEGSVSSEEDVQILYTFQPLSAGKARFEGARLQLADLHGLFYRQTFIPLPEEVLVLPTLVNLTTHTSMKKRQNMLMPPGIHHLSAPGSGSELLDLRDYIPGDPPKTIAWKVSARRDRLITKEYESEVPLRCTLFLDTSSAVRLGPAGATPLSRMVEIAASVAQVNMSSRDMTGVCLFDEKDIKVVRPARSRRHLIQMLHLFSDAAGATPEVVDTDQVEPLLPLAYSFAQEVYPEQMRPELNRMPIWHYFFAPTPSVWLSDAGPTRRTLRRIVLFLCSLPYILILGYLFVLLAENYAEGPQKIADYVATEVFKDDPIRLKTQWSDLIPPFETVAIAYLVIAFLCFPLWLKLFQEAIPMLFQPRRRRMIKYRKRMAALLAQRYKLGPGGIEMLNQEDRLLGRYLQRFLHEHRAPFTPALHDSQGRYRFARPDRLEVLSKALLHSVGRGRDNELFVLFVDLMEMEDHLEPLLKAVKVALARHHQVVLLLPWPVGLPVPKSNGDDPPKLKLPRGYRRRRGRKRRKIQEEKLILDLENLTYQRYAKAYHLIRTTFARLHVPVLCAAEQDSVKLILERMDRLRHQQRQPMPG